MRELTSGFKARLEYILDEVCLAVPSGGDHELRCHIAKRLTASVEAGERSLERLSEVARASLEEFYRACGLESSKNIA